MCACLCAQIFFFLLEKTQKATKPKEKGKHKGQVQRQIQVSFKPELDVRGEIGADAWIRVDKYIDDAMLSGLSSVRIIHGKGTGALKRALWEYFRTDARIASYRLGAYGEGDAGVTVIELK